MPREIVIPQDIPRIAIEPDATQIIGTFSSTMGLLAAKFRQKARELNILRARREGALAGTEGPVEIRKGIKAQDRAFNDSANQASMNRLQVRIRQELADFEQKNQLNGEEFRRLSSLFIDSAVSEMRKQDPELASVLQSRAASFQLSASLRIRNVTLNNQREELNASIIEGQVMELTEIQQQTEALFSEDTDIVSKALDSVLESYFNLERLWVSPDPGGQGTLLSADEVVKRRISTIVGIYEQAISGFIRSHKTPESLKELESSMKAGTFLMPTIGVNQLGEVIGEGDITILNPKDDLPSEVFNRLINLIRSERGRRIQDESGERQLDAHIAELEANGTSSISFTDTDALILANGDQVIADQIMSEVETAREVASIMPLVNAESVHETNERIEDFVVEGIDAPEELKFRDILIAAQNQKIRNLKLDPFLTASSTEPGKDLIVAFDSGTIDEPTFRKLMLDLEESMGKGLRGFVPSIMSKNEALEFVNTFNDIEIFQDRIEAMNQFQSRFGQGRLLEFALNDLVDAGLPPGSAVLVGLDSRLHENRILAQAGRVGLKELQNRFHSDIKLRDIKDEVAERFREWERALPSGNDLLIQGTKEAAILMSSGFIVFDQVDRVRTAVDNSFKTLIEKQWFIANNVLVPLVQDSEQIRTIMTPGGFQRVLLEIQKDIDPALIDTSDLATFDYVQELFNSGRMVTNESKTGVEFVDANQRPVLSLETGEKIGLSFGELFDIGEDIIVSIEVERLLVSTGFPESRREEFRAQFKREIQEKRKRIQTERELIQNLKSLGKMDLLFRERLPRSQVAPFIRATELKMVQNIAQGKNPSNVDDTK